jgi:hypothetical protein
VLHTDIDLLHPPADLEKTKHKLKRLVAVCGITGLREQPQAQQQMLSAGSGVAEEQGVAEGFGAWPWSFCY